MKYLILIADVDEFLPIKENLADLIKKEYKIKRMPAFDFSFNGSDCTVVCFGIGKVNAATGAAVTLSTGTYDGVINTGWSGGVSGVHKGDIIVSDSCVECDFDFTVLGKLPGQKPYQDEYIYGCDNFLHTACCGIDGFTHGKLGTGDLFLADKEKKDNFKKIFGINAFDMESGALASVCSFFDVPFVSVRKISDTADDVGTQDYRTSLRTDVTAFSDIIIEILKHL